MRAVARSKPIPATIGMLFGGLWAFIAAMALPPGWRVSTTIIAAAATIILIARLWWTREPASNSSEQLFKRKAYQTAVIAEVLAIYAASALLSKYGLQGYFIQVVGIIVGLHFIGLWFATRSSRFLGIAAGMTILSAIAILLPTTSHLIELRNFFTGAGNALVLWLGAGRSSFIED